MSESIRPRGEDAAASPPAPGAANGPQPLRDAVRADEFVAELKKGIEATRLPPDLKAQIVADLPPPEERERLFREMQEKGGWSFEEIIASLEVDHQL
jgi:hypothetical protein